MDLAAFSPEPQPLSSARLSGRWRLVYTDSPFALGAKRPAWQRPIGDRLQIIDTTARPWLVRNAEGFPLFTAATAELTPMGDDPGRRAEVAFLELKTFGLFAQTPPASGSLGSYEYLYLDDELLITRGNRGNLFVMQRAGALGAPLPRVQRAGKSYYAGMQYFTGMLRVEPEAAAPALSDQLLSKPLDNLSPNMRAAGSATAVLCALMAGFLGANGLLPGQAGPGMPPPPY
jgi:hypothetical protein